MGPLERLVALERRFGRFGQAALFVVVVKNPAAVLRAVVAELLVFDRRIDVVPEHVEQFFVGHFLRVIDDLHGFRMPGAARRNFLVGRIFFLPAGIAGGGRDHARQHVERVLHAPEAAAGERGFRVGGSRARFGRLRVTRSRAGKNERRAQREQYIANCRHEAILLEMTASFMGRVSLVAITGVSLHAA